MVEEKAKQTWMRRKGAYEVVDVVDVEKVAIERKISDAKDRGLTYMD